MPLSQSLNMFSARHSVRATLMLFITMNTHAKGKAGPQSVQIGKRGICCSAAVAQNAADRCSENFGNVTLYTVTADRDYLGTESDQTCPLPNPLAEGRDGPA